MKIENRQKFLIVLTGTLFALLLCNMVVLDPMAKWFSARSQKITELRKQVKDGRLMLKREAYIRSRWDGMLTNALPSNTSLAEQQVLKALDNWSSQSGAEITDITPQWNNDDPDYMTLGCHVGVSGNLGTLSRFLYQIESDPLARKLDTVQLNTDNDTGQQLTLNLQIDGLALVSQVSQAKQ